MSGIRGYCLLCLEVDKLACVRTSEEIGSCARTQGSAAVDKILPLVTNSGQPVTSLLVGHLVSWPI